jgi:hypothetical protein
MDEAERKRLEGQGVKLFENCQRLLRAVADHAKLVET